jgi:hypothetical protein
MASTFPPTVEEVDLGWAIFAALKQASPDAWITSMTDAYAVLPDDCAWDELATIDGTFSLPLVARHLIALQLSGLGTH